MFAKTNQIWLLWRQTAR